MQDEGWSRRRRLTPIGDELKPRIVEVGKPSLLDRWRRRPRLLPQATTWYGRLCVAAVRIATGLAVSGGVTLLIAWIGGWTSRDSLPRVFFILGVAMMGTISMTLFGHGYARMEAAYDRSRSGRERSQQVRLALYGFCLILVGVYLDARR